MAIGAGLIIIMFIIGAVYWQVNKGKPKGAGAGAGKRPSRNQQQYNQEAVRQMGAPAQVYQGQVQPIPAQQGYQDPNGQPVYQPQFQQQGQPTMPPPPPAPQEDIHVTTLKVLVKIGEKIDQFLGNGYGDRDEEPEEEEPEEEPAMCPYYAEHLARKANEAESGSGSGQPRDEHGHFIGKDGPSVSDKPKRKIKRKRSTK